MNKKKTKGIRNVNVICFFMLFIPGLFSASTMIDDVRARGFDVFSQAFAIRNATFIFLTLCASMIVLYGNRNKHFYSIGATLGIVATETFLLNKAIASIVGMENIYDNICAIFGFLGILLLMIIYDLVLKKIIAKKPYERLLSSFASTYTLIILGIALASGMEKVLIHHDSIIATSLVVIQYILLINAPLVIYVLIRQAKADE